MSEPAEKLEEVEETFEKLEVAVDRCLKALREAIDKLEAAYGAGDE